MVPYCPSPQNNTRGHAKRAGQQVNKAWSKEGKKKKNDSGNEKPVCWLSRDEVSKALHIELSDIST